MLFFNSENFIEDAVNSITNQSFRDFEFLIMDDGSSDNTHKIIQNLSYEDRRIKIYQNDKNIGLTKSLNLLINEAKGDFIVRQDADDISYVNRLRSQIDILSKSKFSACTTRAKIMGTNNIKPKYTYLLPKKMVIKFKKIPSYMELLQLKRKF